MLSCQLMSKEFNLSSVYAKRGPQNIHSNFILILLAKNVLSQMPATEKTLLQPLPTLDKPNIRIHANVAEVNFYV
jgi:hypothetical protein